MAHTRDGIAYAGGSDTSYEAAIKARHFVSEQGMRVYHWLKDRGTGTRKEAECELHISTQSLCARLKALEDAGAIRKTGDKRLGCVAYEVIGQPLQRCVLF